VNIIKDKPAVVVAEGANGNLSIIILVLLRIIYKYKLLLWSFGYKPDYGFNPRKRLADTYRLMTYNLVDGIIFYSNQGKQQASKYLNNHEKLFVANNTIDTNQESVIYANLKILGKSQIRSDLGIESKKMVLYIGRLIKDKQVDHLLNSFSLVEAITGDVLLVLIGDGPEKDNLHQLAIKLNLKNILFCGSIYDKMMVGKYLYISDVIVNPGRLGNSVIHSFCYKTPVIAQKINRPFHGEGAEYLIDGYNGFWVKDGDKNNLKNKILYCLNNEELLESLSRNAQKTSNKYSVGNFVKQFNDVIMME